MPQFDTFISYAHNDGLQSADKIRDFLATRNLRVWKDEQLRLGDEIDKTIRGAIDNSASMLVVLTDEAIDSQYVQREVKYAKDKGIRVLPVILKPTKFSASKKWKEIFSEVNWGRVDQNTETRYLTDRVLADVYRSLQNKSGRDKPILAFYNFKGGVGKTTLCAMLSTYLFRHASRRFSVAMVDCDAQSNLTSLFLSRRDVQDHTARSNNLIGMLEPERFELTPGADWSRQILGGTNAAEIAPRCLRTIERDEVSGKLLSVIPNSIEAVKYGDLNSEEVRGRLFQNFQNSIEALTYKYDFVMLDCNPNATLLSNLALGAATDIIVPIKCDKYALDGLENLDTVIRDSYNLECSYGPHKAMKQIWTLVNFARQDRLQQSNRERSAFNDQEAFVFKEIFEPALDGGRDFARIADSLLETRIPDSGYVNPSPASTGPITRENRPTDLLVSFFQERRARHVTQAFERLSNEIIRKTLPENMVPAVL